MLPISPDRLEIRDLRGSPQLFDDVADRIWRAWWKPRGAELGEVEQNLRKVVEAEGFPFTLVATCGGEFAGTATAVASDLAERPHLTPWLAALWVDPAYRSRHIGRSLIEHVVNRLGSDGHQSTFLCARLAMRQYYLGLGWELIEEQVGPHSLDVFQMSLAARTLRS